MFRIWETENKAILITVGIIVLTGMIFNHWFLSATITLTAYILWMYSRLIKLEKWLARGTKASEVYDDSGFLDDIIRHLYHQKKDNNKRKKRTKEILRRLNRNIAALPDATILLNNQLEIEWSNAPAQYLLGINSRYDIGQRISNLFRHPKFLRYLISPDKKQHLEIESPINPIITLQIKIVRFGNNQRLLTARNISDQRQLQEALKNFVANASHELKTPLTTISGHLEMLENESGLSKTAQQSIKIAQKQSGRMRTLIQDLLLLSQVESYQLQPNEGESISISEVMTNAMSSINIECNKRNIICDIPEDFYLLGIKSEIEGICINLIDNAVKYSGKTSSQIKISWSKNKMDEYIFSVKDQGVGISAQELPHITDRYYRGSQAAAGQFSGSGLGLAIVEQAVTKHGAKLDIQSKVGKGSRFSVTFPSYRTLTDKKANVVQFAS